jgi:hypothetical protein
MTRRDIADLVEKFVESKDFSKLRCFPCGSNQVTKGEAWIGFCEVCNVIHPVCEACVNVMRSDPREKGAIGDSYWSDQRSWPECPNREVIIGLEIAYGGRK